MKKSSLLIVACLSCSAMNSSAGFFSKIGSWFNKQEEVVKQEITHPVQKTITVENSIGDIYVKSWHQEGIAIKAIKHANSREDIEKINITIDTKNKEIISVATKVPNTLTNYTVDYQLFVPQKMAVRMKTHKGNIRSKRAHGSVYANTDEGNIEFISSTEKACAVVNEKGMIAIQQAKGAVQATIEQGNIILNDTENSVLASTAKGSITMVCHKVKPTSSIRLNASGNIELHLPENINAHLQAATSEKGKIISDHYINLEPRITKINDDAWHVLKQNIEGTIGSGEAEIVLHADSGIKILETAA